MHFAPSQEWTPLVDPRRSTVEKLVKEAPKTGRLELHYKSGIWGDDQKKIPGLIQAARPLPLTGLRLVNLYAKHSSDREIRDYSDTAPALCDLTKTIFPELAAASWLSLDTLEVIHAEDGLVATRSLKGAACFEGLRRFVLEEHTKLPSWLRLPEARELVLESIGYGVEKAIMTLVSSAPNLEVLWLDRAGPEIVKALGSSSFLSGMMKALGKAPFLPKLRSLALTNTLAEPDILALAELDRPFEHLDLRYSRMGEKGALALATSPTIAQCGSLDLRNNEFPDAIAARFREHLGDRVLFDQ